MPPPAPLPDPGRTAKAVERRTVFVARATVARRQLKIRPQIDRRPGDAGRERLAGDGEIRGEVRVADLGEQAQLIREQDTDPTQ